MTPVRAFKIASVSTTIAAGLILALRWMTPAVAGWNRIDEMCRQAQARHEFLCVYTPLGDNHPRDGVRWMAARGAGAAPGTGAVSRRAARLFQRHLVPKGE
jgi:hypothetical protein